MITSSIKKKYCKDLISWGLIKFGGPITARKIAPKKPVDLSKKQPMRISDINLVRGLH